MLDAIRNITNLKGQLVEQQAELGTLITMAREERSALSAMLSSLTTRSANLLPMDKSLELVSDKATSITARLNDISKRLAALDGRAKELEAAEKRIQALKEAVLQAERNTQKALLSEGEFHRQRQAVQQLSAQTLQTQATLDALKKERSTFEELRGQLRIAETGVTQSIDQAGALRGELDQVRAAATSLTEDYARIRELSREAREDSSRAMAAVKEIDAKLGSLAHFKELSQTTEERLTSLNSLAEHVSHKAKALESQQHTVEHAVVQANRVNEMVWAMDVQIAKLNEGLKQAAQAEDTIGRIEKLNVDTAKRMESAAKLNQEVQRETRRLESEGRLLLHAVRDQLSVLAMHKKEFDSFDERLRLLRASVGDAESRMEALASRDKILIDLTQKTDSLTKQFENLFTQSDELAKRQLALESTLDRLAEVDDLAKNTAWQMDSLKQTGQDLQVLRKEIQEFHKSHAEVAQLRDKLGADRRAFEAFDEHVATMSTRTPELEAKMEAILGKMGVVEDATLQATRLSEWVAELDAQISRVCARLPFVESTETRLNGLNAISAEVDQKLEGQLARRAEVDALKTACEGLAVQVTDTQHKLEDVRTLERTLVPLIAQVRTLRTDIATAYERISDVKYDEATIVQQEKRLTELVATGRAVAADVAERSLQVRALSKDLARSSSIKDDLLSQLDGVQVRQRDAVSQVHAAEDQLARAEQMFKELEQRQAQVALGERKLMAVESRLAEIQQLAIKLDKQIVFVTTREQLVNTVKAEVDQVHEISARSKADLAHVAEHRFEVATLKANVDGLLSRLAETDERIAELDARRKLIDEVQMKTNAIVRLLDDVQATLETLGEQKAVVDHVAEKVEQLEFVLQEARNTQRTLQQERELAERIEQGIKQLRSRTDAAEDRRRTASAAGLEGTPVMADTPANAVSSVLRQSSSLEPEAGSPEPPRTQGVTVTTTLRTTSMYPSSGR